MIGQGFVAAVALVTMPAAGVSPFAIRLLPDSVRKSPSSRFAFAMPNAQVARTPRGLFQREAVQGCPSVLQACHSHGRHIGFALLHATLFLKDKPIWSTLHEVHYGQAVWVIW